MEPESNTPVAPLPPMAQLARKMASIMGKLQRLNQNGVNTQGWTFTSVDDITDAIRALMAEFGIALFSKMVKATEVKDGKTTRATVDMEFELVCADTGFSKVMTWTGSAEDYSDKALNKAAVYAEKFWLKSTFLVSTGKDPDAKSPRIDRREGAQQRPPQPQQAQRQLNVPGDGQQDDKPKVDTPWLDAEKKLALTAYAIEDKLLDPDDTWSDFMKLGELKDDTDCLKFASGNDLYKHVKERAATIKKQTAANVPTAQQAAQLLGNGGDRRIPPKPKTPEPELTGDALALVNGEVKLVTGGKSPFAQPDDTAGEVLVNGAKVAVPAPPF